MCYPCRNCGSCETAKIQNVMHCPRCGTLVIPEEGKCKECGWEMPAPPGGSKRKSTNGTTSK